MAAHLGAPEKWRRFLRQTADGFMLCDDDGSEIDPNLVPKPPLCSMCANDADPKQEMLCTLTRLDQQDEIGFECGAFRPIRIEGP